MNPRDEAPVHVWTNTGHFFGRIGGSDRTEQDSGRRAGVGFWWPYAAVRRPRARRWSWRTVLRTLITEHRLGGRADHAEPLDLTR